MLDAFQSRHCVGRYFDLENISKVTKEYKICINKHLSLMWSESSTKDSRRQDVYLKVASRAVHVQACLNHSLPKLRKSRSFLDITNICHVDFWGLYLCPNALPPVRRLDVKIFHEHRLSLPRGVREEEEGKANKLQIWDGTDNKCFRCSELSCNGCLIWIRVYLSLELCHLAVEVLVRSKAVLRELLRADLWPVWHLLVVGKLLDQTPGRGKVKSVETEIFLWEGDMNLQNLYT